MTKEKFEYLIKSHMRRHGSIGHVKGMLVYCNAYVESSIRRRDGWGWETKLYGIDYKWKGRTKNDLIDAGIMSKRILMEGLRLFSGLWFLAPIFWLRRKHIIFSIIQILRCEVLRKAQKQMLNADFSPFCGELLIRARDQIKDENYQEIAYWAIYALEFDNCYRLCLQDVFGIINLARLRSRPREEIFRAANETIKRNRRMGNKWTIFWTMIKLLSLLPGTRKKMVKFIFSLDMSKIRMDEDDRYWTLRYDVYEFGGRVFDDRFKEVKRIDKERGHFIICDQ